VGRRRCWNDQGRIVAGSHALGAIVSEVVRRYDVSPYRLSGLLLAAVKRLEHGAFGWPLISDG
jgi:hypothetical protein